LLSCQSEIKYLCGLKYSYDIYFTIKAFRNLSPLFKKTFLFSLYYRKPQIEVRVIWSQHPIFANTGYTQTNGTVSKVNKKFTSHLSLAEPTPSAAATVQVSHALPAVRFSCLLQGHGASFQYGIAAGKSFSVCSVLRRPYL
jgi:ribosomal protein L31